MIAVWSTPALAAVPVVTGQWDFDAGDLRATVGADLQFVGDTAGNTTFPVLNINGQPASVMAFPGNSTSQGFYLRHGAKPNGGGQFVNQYTLIMDVMYPASSSDQWRALFQTDPFNHTGNEADFFVGNNGSLPAPDGIGTDGQFDGSLAPNTWYRIALVVDLTATNGQQLTKYINGAKVATQSLAGGLDGRYALGPTAQLFTSGISGSTQPGFVNSIRFANGPMSDAAITALGGPSANGIAQAVAPLQISSLNVSGISITLNWTGAADAVQVESTADPSQPDWQPLGDPTTNRSIAFQERADSFFYRLEQIGVPSGGIGSLLPPPVDPLVVGQNCLPSFQTLNSAGQNLVVGGRPVDLALSPDGTKVFLKNMNNVQVVDVATWRLRQTISYPADGASMHGIATSRDGAHVYVTGARNQIYDYTVSTNGLLSYSRTVILPDNSDPCGLAISADGTKAYVCLGKNNTLGVVDLPSGITLWEINVGMAPWDVALSPDGATAAVSDWGGRRGVAGDLTAFSAGSYVVVDDRGIASSGAVSFVDLNQNREVSQVPTGLHPSDLELSPDGNTLFVANANSDTVTVINTQTKAVRETILVRPDPTLPFGSESDGLAVSKDGKTLFVASAGNNAVAVIELPNLQHTNSLLQGFFPTDWYPGAVVVDSNFVYVANVKGLGSLPSNLFAYQGTAGKIPVPTTDALSKLTARVQENGLIPQILQTKAPAQAGQPPLPVPGRVGEPSVFQHVVYVIKENKTYDIVLGDIPRGNGNSNLCLFPQFVTPNHHALATQYVLLDNYYCNGVLSSDGHSWSVEANASDHIEKSFAAFARSYSLGTDALTYSSSGFIWNNVLSHGLSFRNYGELIFSSPAPGGSTWLQIYTDYTNHAGQINFRHNTGVAPLWPYTCTNVPGWNLGIPDVVRADGFIQELHTAESNGVWAAFHILYLPEDHTAGSTPGYPTPRAQLADNDLALGRAVEAVTKSRFGSNTCIFVIEDDPQSGYDHVDGHRSLCLVISPYTKRGQTISKFYNQVGVVHTMEQMLGLPPMNQQDAAGPLMTDCFTNTPDFTPYTALANNVPLDEMNPGTLAALSWQDRYWAGKSVKLDFSKPDLINEDTFNRIIWHSVRGYSRYPSEFVGAHGKGLKKLGLALDKNARKDDDD
ncbi:MAG: Phosphoesterase family protein [Pedosphaera sp.]|nr:Phosphoesterase family protein [Pedosphaera sp.]